MYVFFNILTLCVIGELIMPRLILPCRSCVTCPVNLKPCEFTYCTWPKKKRIHVLSQLKPHPHHKTSSINSSIQFNAKVLSSPSHTGHKNMNKNQGNNDLMPWSDFCPEVCLCSLVSLTCNAFLSNGDDIQLLINRIRIIIHRLISCCDLSVGNSILRRNLELHCRN